MNFIRLLSIIKKEFIHIKRDPISLIIALLMPVIFVSLLGRAITTDVNDVSMIVLDADKSIESRELVTAFSNSGYFNIEKYANTVEEINDGVDSGEYRTALIINSNFGKDLKRGIKPEALIIVDGTDPTISRIVLQNGTMIGNMYNINKTIGFQNLDYTLNTKVWYNNQMESSKFVIPGLVGLVMQNITIMLTAFALVREKERGNIEQLIVTPIKPIELILGKLIPYVFIGYADFLIALYLGTWMFSVKIQGELNLLLILGMLFVLCALAMGILISTLSQNQAQAMQIGLITILPSVLLSGFMFPREAMPAMIQMIGNVLPITYFMKILRGVILKGVGFEFLIKETITLGVMTILILSIAMIRFRKSLD